MTNFFRCSCAARSNFKIPLRTPNRDSLPPDRLVIRSQQEMRLMPIPGQLPTVVTPDSPASNDRNFHGE